MSKKGKKAKDMKLLEGMHLQQEGGFRTPRGGGGSQEVRGAWLVETPWGGLISTNKGSLGQNLRGEARGVTTSRNTNRSGKKKHDCRFLF